MVRKQKTMFDYMVIGISPALVATMVTSLALFVSTVLNPSPFLGRFNFILIMYSMATVSVARISIEEGKERAILFGIPLAVVTMIAMSSMVQYEDAVKGMKLIYSAVVIAITWWSAHQLTWDCTVIEEHDDSSNQGLLQKIGLERLITESQKTVEEAEDSASHALGEEEAKQSWFEQWKDNRQKPHTPGVWVIYYSLAALPLFGFGQLFTNAEVSNNCFKYLLCYVGSGLGLLLTTSLLGLRRYLRHRDIEMPREMAGTWLAVGALMIGGFMAFAFFLPRPGNTQQLANASSLFNQSQDAFDTSEYGMGPDGKNDDNASRISDEQQQSSGEDSSGQPSQTGRQQGEEGKQSDSQTSGTSSGQTNEESQGSGGSAEESDDQDSQSDKRPSGDSSNQSDEQKNPNNSTGSPSEQGDDDENSNPGEEGNQSNQNSNSEPNNPQEIQPEDENQDNATNGQNQQHESESEAKPSSQSSQAKQDNSPSFHLPVLPSLVGIGTIIQILFWIAVSIATLYSLIKNHKALWQTLKEMLRGFLNWFARVFAGTDQEHVDEEEPDKQAPQTHPPFASFRNPFTTNAQMSLPELVQYSFHALESLGRELGIERQTDQTPNEFSQAMAEHITPLSQSTLRLGKHYSLAAYAPTLLNQSCVQDLQTFWEQVSIVEIRKPVVISN